MPVSSKILRVQWLMTKEFENVQTTLVFDSCAIIDKVCIAENRIIVIFQNCLYGLAVINGSRE